jgi:predicted TPR repeat methyltransferase
MPKPLSDRCIVLIVLMSCLPVSSCLYVMLQVELSRKNGGYHTVLVQDVHDALRDAATAAIAPHSSDTATAAALDLILSADTFIYVGQLDLCFELSARALRTGGLFAFSIELLADAHVHSTAATAATTSTSSISCSSSSVHSISSSANAYSSGSSSVIETVGFKLVQTGRYAHTEQYIEQLASANSFTVAVKTAITVRTEGAQPIAGCIYVLCKD